MHLTILKIIFADIVLSRKSQLKGVKTNLYSRRGFYLSINRDNGTVIGVKNSGEGTLFYLIPVGLRVVSIQHVDTLLYVGMNSEGRLYSTDAYSTECKFKESIYENYYVVYSSTLYKQLQNGRRWNIGLGRDGRPVKGYLAKKEKSSSHFIPQPIEVQMLKEPSVNELAIPSRSTST